MDFALLILTVTVLISKTESTVEDLVFVQTENSVQLDIQHKKLPPFKTFVWLYSSEYLVKMESKNVTLHTSYIERLDFNDKTFSLTIKNMQKTDSGVYKARATGDRETYIGEHNVSVLDPVKTPLLNYTVISISSCVVNVSCIGHDLTLSSSYHSNCSEEEVTSSKIYNLTLYCKEDVVVCNYSNPVSWKNDTIKMKQLCTHDTTHENVILEDHHEEYSTFSSMHWLIVIAISVSVLLLAGGAVLYCVYRKNRKDAQQTDNTIYAEVEPNNKVQTDLEMSQRSENPHTVYGSESLVQGQQEQISTRECHVYNDVPERISAKKQRGINHPQTTYCTVGQHKRPLDDTENNLSIYSVVSKLQNGKPVK